MQELFFCLVQKLAGTVSLVQRPALPWPGDMFGEARLHLRLPLPEHNLQQWLHSPVVCASPGKSVQGLRAAGRSIALEMLLLQMAPEGLSRARRFSCVNLQCGEQLSSHCSTSAGMRPSWATGGWEQAPERCPGKLAGPCRKRSLLLFCDASSHLVCITFASFSSRQSVSFLAPGQPLCSR